MNLQSNSRVDLRCSFTRGKFINLQESININRSWFFIDSFSPLHMWLGHPWVGNIPREGNGNPLRYPCRENPTDGGYSPRGRKELDTTEQLRFGHLACEVSHHRADGETQNHSETGTHAGHSRCCPQSPTVVPLYYKK